ncbi:MAG: DUF2911 domain-containing protein [Gemmatimonadota bacterium]
MAAVEVLPSVALACVPQRPDMERVSAYDSATVDLNGGRQARICYGRPGMRARKIFGGLVPYDQLWRTGANEPTTLHLPFAAEIAGVRVEPGHVSLYTIPRAEQPWTIVVNRATDQWGHEGAYTPAVEAQEVGRGQAPAERLDAPVETFTIRWERAGERSGELLLEWARTRVRIPFRALP